MVNVITKDPNCVVRRSWKAQELKVITLGPYSGDVLMLTSISPWIWKKENIRP